MADAADNAPVDNHDNHAPGDDNAPAGHAPDNNVPNINGRDSNNMFDIAHGADFGILFCFDSRQLALAFQEGLFEVRRGARPLYTRRHFHWPDGQTNMRTRSTRDTARWFLDTYAIPFATRWGHGALSDDVREAWQLAEETLDVTNRTVFDDSLLGGLVRTQRLPRERGMANAWFGVTGDRYIPFLFVVRDGHLHSLE